MGICQSAGPVEVSAGSAEAAASGEDDSGMGSSSAEAYAGQKGHKIRDRTKMAMKAFIV